MDTPHLLDMLTQPAFRVRQGIIDYVNPAAAGCLIEAGKAIGPLLFTGHEEYRALDSGSLYLQLQLGPLLADACVTRSGQEDIFVLEQAQEDPALHALALAAMALRAPLAGAMSAAEQLLPALESDSALDGARIQKNLHQLLRLVGNMSDSARCAQRPGSCRELRNICAVLDEIFDKAAAAAQEAGVTVRYQGLGRELVCPVDSQLLERAVYNLLSNAMKFSSGVIDASVSRKGQRLYLTVSDSGEGIPAALRGTLFSRYQRQPGLEDSRYGLGLGMVLIRAAAAAHGGTVLTQTGDTGTQVTMTFSLACHPDQLRSPIKAVDYTGERDHALVEFSQFLPAECYLP